MSDRTVPKTRAIDLEVQVDASAETIWRALTNAEELQNWFPLEARIEPGVGGSMFISWGPGAEGTGAIEVWEPGRHLRVVERSGTDEDGRPVRIAVDYHIEARGGTSVLRLVHSGFSADADWNEYYDATERGWTYFLWHLRFYLEHHHGVPRQMAWSRLKSKRTREDVWQRLLSPQGLSLSGPEGKPTQAPVEGQRCSVRLDSARDEGAIVASQPGAHLALTMAGLNDGVLFVEFEPGSEGWYLGLWLSVYGLPVDRVEQLQSWVEELGRRLVARNASSTAS